MSDSTFTLELESNDSVTVELDRKDAANPMVVVSFPAYLLKSPRKAIEEKETKPDSGCWTIPKAATFVYANKRFKAPLQSDYATGYRLNLRVDRALSPAKRKAIYDGAVSKGRKVVKAEQAFELDDMDSAPVSAEPTGSRERIA